MGELGTTKWSILEKNVTNTLEGLMAKEMIPTEEVRKEIFNNGFRIQIIKSGEATDVFSAYIVMNNEFRKRKR